MRRLLLLLLVLTALLAGPALPTGTVAPQAPPHAIAAVASPDFDRDGRADLAYSFVGDAEDRQVRVEYATGGALLITSAEVIPDAWGDLGNPLARDLDADGYTDLAFTAEGRESGGHLCVVHGSAAGLQLPTLTCVELGSLPGRLRPTALILLEAPTPRLAVGVSSTSTSDSGRVLLLGLTGDGAPGALIRTLRPGKGSLPRLADRGSFGSTLASRGNRLFIGAPAARIGSTPGAGAVMVVSFAGNGSVAARVISQSTKGVPGAVARNDAFGSSLAARDGYLVVGTRQDAVGPVRRTGSVQVFQLTATGVVPRQRLAQSSTGVPGKAEPNDRFGSAVALGTVCAGVPGVIVGGPGEVVTTGADFAEYEGSAWVIPWTATRDCPARQLWEGHGIGGTLQSGREIGEFVAVLRDAGAGADLVVIAGGGLFSDMSPVGALHVWSAVTTLAAGSEPVSVTGVAGR